MRTALCTLVGVFAFLPGIPSWAADGLTPNPDAVPWVRWQGRLLAGSGASSVGSSLLDGSIHSPGGFSLMGDYYFARSFLGDANLGGFRATSGVIVGHRGLLGSTPSLPASGRNDGLGYSSLSSNAGVAFAADAQAGDTFATVPYVGLGYSSLSVRSGWSFNADLGLLGFGPASNVKLGRAYNTTPSLDDQVRDLRPSPMLQLGVSYSF